jgi:hypothetical protein
MIARTSFTGDGVMPKHKRPVGKSYAITRRQGVALTFSVVAIALLALAFVPVDRTSASPSRETPCGNCHDVGADTLMTVTGLPAEYTPSTTYTITITVDDLNGANGENGFYLTIDAGTLSNPGPNAEVNDPAASASTVDTRPRPEASWTVDWTAPASGTANIHVWAVSATDTLTGSSAPYDDDTFAISPSAAIPEFHVLLLPIVGIAGIILIAARAKGKAKKQ